MCDIHTSETHLSLGIIYNKENSRQFVPLPKTAEVTDYQLISHIFMCDLGFCGLQCTFFKKNNKF